MSQFVAPIDHALTNNRVGSGEREAVWRKFVSAALIKLLKQLPETSLVLNVLRPLLAKSEREVRQAVVQWVAQIRQTPNLDSQTEEKLVAILSQLVEQKIRSLS